MSDEAIKAELRPRPAPVRPLAGLRVLDLSKVLAGPVCGQTLGDLGAEVIKVEPVDGGDDTRKWTPRQDGESAVFLAVNHNKRSLALDLKQPAGRAIVHALARSSDIVLQGFGGDTARKLAVDYDSLRALNPALIYCEISGYGRDGPLGGEPGYDVMLQAFSGMLSTMGQPAGDLARVSFSPVDLGTGQNAVIGILAAVLHREQTGEGSYVEVTLLDTALAYMGYLAQSWWASGTAPGKHGTAHPTMCPYQAFEAADGPFMLGAGNDAQWQRFCRAAGLEALLDHPDLQTNADRVRHMAETVRLVQARLIAEPVAYWLRVLTAAKVPCAPIHSLPEALAHPQVAARDMVTSSEHARLGQIRRVALPVRINQDARQAGTAPPQHGEHSVEILRELGHDEADIARLIKDRVIRSLPNG